VDDPGTVRLDELPGEGLELAVGSLRVRVETGPLAGSLVDVAHERVRLGSAEDNDVCLSSQGVSRYHAELEAAGGRVLVRDLESTNGTFVGEVRVTEAEVPPGARLRLGTVELSVALHTTRRRARVLEEDGYAGLVGATPAMRELYGLIRAAAPAPVTVLLTGESGTGKEQVARALHEESGRAGPLVVFDAATADPEMIRSDLFGHRKGSFTGALEDRDGCFREAHQGTLFLDELGELPLELQPRLLRVLERREVVPLGSSRPVAVDVRLVAATHRDLRAMVEAGTFREDLYHRLAVIPMRVPPLRERVEDLPLLIRHLKTVTGSGARFGVAAEGAMRAYSWPGNVRELRNVVERVGVLCAGREAAPEDLGLAGPRAGQAPPPPEARALEADRAAESAGAEVLAATQDGDLPTLAEAERRLFAAALEKHGGNKARAAEELGVPISTFRRRLKAMGLSSES
jgi:DNA-binding NtrC family response regulator